MACRTWQTRKSMILKLKQFHAVVFHLQIEVFSLGLGYLLIYQYSICNERFFYFVEIIGSGNHLGLVLHSLPHWLCTDERLLSSYCSLHLFKRLRVEFLIYFEIFFLSRKLSSFKILEFSI